MEKLEQILHAEDAARARVAEARDDAIEIDREGVAAVAAIRSGIIADAKEAAAARAAEVIEEARVEAAALDAQATVQRAAVLDAAEARFPAAVARVLGELGV